jgi:hypothetical protein
LKPSGRFNAVEYWHGDIEHGDVWEQLDSGIYCRLPVTYFCDDLTGISGDEVPNVLPHLLVVVSQ